MLASTLLQPLAFTIINSSHLFYYLIVIIRVEAFTILPPSLRQNQQRQTEYQKRLAMMHENEKNPTKLALTSSSPWGDDSPAMLWDYNDLFLGDGTNAIATTPLSPCYWDPDLLSQLSSLSRNTNSGAVGVDHDGEDINHTGDDKEHNETTTTTNLQYISYSVLFQLIYHLIHSLHSLIKKTIEQHHIKESANTTEGEKEDKAEPIPIAVGIPDGPLMPIAILLVHILNDPRLTSSLLLRSEKEESNSSTSSTNDRYKSSSYYCVLVPLEPNEGKDRLRYMIQDIQPRIIVACRGKDMDRIKEQISILVSSNATNESEVVPHVVDFVQWVQDAIHKMSSNMKKNASSSKKNQQQRQENQEEDQHQEGDDWKEEDLHTSFLRHFYHFCNSVGDGRDNDESNRDKCNEDVSSLATMDDKLDMKKNERISHIVYTSGTTGQPKGCVSSISALQHYLHVKNQIHDISQACVVLLASSLSFDPCLSDILATFHAKATLAMVPKQVLLSGGCGSGGGSGGGAVAVDDTKGNPNRNHVLQRLGVSHILCTPTVWTILTSSTYHQLRPQDVPSLQVIALGGEPIPNSIRRIWARTRQTLALENNMDSPVLPDEGDKATSVRPPELQRSTSSSLDDTKSSMHSCQLYATYGVTEACVYQTIGEVYQDDEKNSVSLPPSVGHPFPGLGVRICVETEPTHLVDVVTYDGVDGTVDDNSNYIHRPMNVGEVVLYGAQLDQLASYWNRPDFSRDKFIHDESWNASGQLTTDLLSPSDRYFYRTGDLGFIHPETSNLHIMGRIQGDGMVKIRGVRVELGEIEAALIDQHETNQSPDIVAQCLATAISQVSDDLSDKTATATATSCTEIHAYCVLGIQCWKELGFSDGFPRNPGSSDSDGNKTSETPWTGILVTDSALLTLLRARCIAKLKAACAPSAFVLIPELPISATGKKDRRKLPLLKDCISLDYLLDQSYSDHENHDGLRPSRRLLLEHGMAGSIVSETLVDCLNLQTCQQEMLTTNISFSMLGGDSLAATRVTRALYAYHHGVENTRFLGGAFGVLDGCFDVIHLLRAPTLGDFVDFLDRNGVCQPKQEQSQEFESNKSSPSEIQGTHSTDAMAGKQSIEGIQDDEEGQFQSNLYEALMQACTKGQSSVAIALLDAGADPTHGDHGCRLGKVSGRIAQKTLFKSSPLHLGKPTH